MQKNTLQTLPAKVAGRLVKKKANTQTGLDEIDDHGRKGDAERVCKNIIERLEKLQDPANAAGMKRFGISGGQVLGIPVPVLRQMAKEIGKDHALALELWQSGIHEARILASMVGEPDAVTPARMDAWMRDFDSWDVCDQTCGNLFDKTAHAWKKARQWAHHEKEFQRRAGFALMATLAWHEKAGKAGRKGKTKPDRGMDAKFEAFFPLIIQYADDPRNFVKKAVNWALRQIGKRNGYLRKKAMATANAILKAHPQSKAARFVANDALRELRQPTQNQEK